jgi:hypothetical protein
MSTVAIPLMSRDNTEIQENEGTRDESTTIKRSNVKPKALEAWRFIVTSGALAGIVILIINVITLAVMYGQHQADEQSITFFTGNCETAGKINTGTHLVINMLSTILLAYSNFSMQCLGSPSRTEVDSAHSQHQWLNIGTPSIRNVFFVSKTKAALWMLLGVSSFPLHMIWNSTVFETKNSYDYFAISITEDFLHGANWTLPTAAESYALTLENTPLHGWTDEDVNHILQDLQTEAMDSKLQGLNVKDCLQRYNTDILSDRRHVLLVKEYPSDWPMTTRSTEASQNSSVGLIYYNLNPTGGSGSETPLYNWLCDNNMPGSSQSCISSSFNYSNWYANLYGGVFGWSTDGPIKYCYSQLAPEKCRVGIVPIFLIIVIGCNVIKITSFVCTLYVTHGKKDQPLCTTGDAIKSFLKQPDPYTRGRCLAAKEDYEKWLRGSEEWIPRPFTVGDLWTGGRYRWHKAVNDWHWIIFVSITTGLAGLTAYIVFAAVISSPISREGFGEPQSNTRMNSKSMGVLRGFLVGNLLQIAVSYVYLALNNILSTMLAMEEWCMYATDRQHNGLRVSSPTPHSAQRSKYFLSVPFKWAIPSMVSLALLHWLVSQMFFFSDLDIYRMQPEGLPQVDTLGYVYTSALPAVLAVSLGGTILLVLTLTALIRKFPANVPLSGCCSASIAAACQPSRVGLDNETLMPEFDPGLACQKLKWGVVEEHDDEHSNNIGHATFAACETTPLVEGKLYA